MFYSISLYCKSSNIAISNANIHLAFLIAWLKPNCGYYRF